MYGSSCFRFGLVLLLTLSAAVAHAQTAGRILGDVKDQSGGVIPGAAVTLTNLATNSKARTSTSSEGRYLFALVEPGMYRLAVEHSGFKTSIQSDLRLEVDQNERLDVTLEVGRPTDRILVEADAPQVDTTGAVLGKVENTQRIQDLPLVDRDTLQLGLLQPGVFAPDPDDGSGNPFSVSGQRSESLTFLLDGADNTDFLGNNIVVSPNPDAVQEFKILTNNYDAEFGRSSGGIVDQVIKSGTNGVHGTLFEFLRNDVFNARDFFLTNRANFKRNVFGAAIGAPLHRDKTFIFADYQGTRRREGESVSTLTVPSMADRSGDFSALCATGGGKVGFDASGNCIAGGTQLVNPATGANYPFNQLPVNSISSNYITRFVPLPNAPDNGFITSPTAAVDEDQGILRVDHHPSERDLITGTYVVDDQGQQVPFPFANGGDNEGRNQTLSLAWTHRFEREWINQFRASANRSSLRFAIPDDTTSPSELGFTNVNSDDPAGVAPTIMVVNGYFFIGPNPNGPTKVLDTVYQYQDHVTIPVGRNLWKFGADFRFVQDNFDYDFYNNGAFSFGEDAAGAINGTLQAMRSPTSLEAFQATTFNSRTPSMELERGRNTITPRTWVS
jgi:Carboxypeptidase regulatory-like domain